MTVPDDIIMRMGNWALLITSVFVIAFWVTYGLLFRWWKTRPGLAVFLFFGALVGMLIASALTVWVGPEYIGRELVRLLVFIYALGASAFLYHTLTRQWQRTGKILDLEHRARHARAVLEKTDPNWRNPS